MAAHTGKSVVVVDVGSATTKSGFAGSDAPMSVFRTELGKWSYGPPSGMKDVYVGDELLAPEVRHCSWRKFRPWQEGDMATSEDDMEHVFNHIYRDVLRCDPKQHAMLHTRGPETALLAGMDRITRMHMETYEVPSICIMTDAVLALFASGRTTGCVLQSGHDATVAVPVENGRILAHAIKKLKIGGRHIEEKFRNKLYPPGCLVAPDVASPGAWRREVNRFSRDCQRTAVAFVKTRAYVVPNYKLALVGVFCDLALAIHQSSLCVS